MMMPLVNHMISVSISGILFSLYRFNRSVLMIMIIIVCSTIYIYEYCSYLFTYYHY